MVGDIQRLLRDEFANIYSSLTQIMTPEQAVAIGLKGLPEDPEGRSRLLVVVGKTDERRILNVLEASPEVTNFRVHDVDI